MSSRADDCDTRSQLRCPRGVIRRMLPALWIALCYSNSLSLCAAEPSGEQIYRQKCASCHGAAGEGVADVHEDPLYGDRSLDEIVKIIDETMPEEKPQQCTGEDARRVAEYIYQTFYTAEARAAHAPPRIELARLTAPQHAHVVADLVGSFLRRREISDERGLRGRYCNDRKFNRRATKLERLDPAVDFNFGTKSPGKNLRDNEFSIQWDGSLIVDTTGEYEIGVQSENGFQLWVNDMEEPLVDGYVAAGPEPTLRSATIRLLAGRAYPLKLEYFKYRDKTASVQLMWRPPHKTWEVIPQRTLAPDRASPTLVITTPFPPDDASYGYPRGTGVSQAWDEATTYAAIEVAAKVLPHLETLAGVKKDAPDRAARLQEFCATFAERAFRRPLTDEQRQVYVASQFAAEDDLEAAVKRSILATLKSPYFVYVNLPRDGQAMPADGYDVAAHLALALWDSLPDEALREAAAQGQLDTREQVAQQARRMIEDPRAKAKLRGFFTHWLQLDHTEHLAKSAEAFPGFDAALAADLRTSLELFLDEVIHSDAADYRQLLLADHLLANERIGKLYQLDVPADGKFHKVPIDKQSIDAGRRAGVVTHPFMLAALSYTDSTSPIHRGVFATRRLLHRPLNPPPNAIQFDDAGFDPHLTMREKVAKITAAQTCQSCHSIINPLGFSLENFDAIGRFRTKEKEREIDASADYTTADGRTIRLKSARDLAVYAASSKEAQLGFVEQLLHHVAKQPARAYGPDTLEKLHEKFAAAQYNIRELLVEVAVTTAFPRLPRGS